jgi:hypothetical protein
MPNVNSDGLFGGVSPGLTRPGRSMDYSQLLEIRRRYIGVHHMVADNPYVSKNIKPFFNQDKMLREPSTNGAVNFYFIRGLTPVYGRISPSK